jgi:hypothetical protein
VLQASPQRQRSFYLAYLFAGRRVVHLDGHLDKPCSDRHLRFADLYRVPPTRFAGKRELFERIKYALDRPGREQELAAWFSFTVHRKLVRGMPDAQIDGPDHPLIQQLGIELARDEAVIKSIRRYRGEDLRYFGQWTTPSGYLYEGGSMHTIAYRRTAALLRERIACIPPRQHSQHVSTRRLHLVNRDEGPSLRDWVRLFVVLGALIILGLMIS